MLLPRMSKDEIQRQMSIDMQQLNRYIKIRSKSLDYWADHTKEGDSTTITWKSPNGNEWITQLVRDGDRIAMVYFTWMESPCGRYILKPQLSREGYCIIVFLPHFFKRYRERMKLGRKMTTMQVVKRFMKHNRTAHVDFHEDGGLEVSFQDGIGLGDYISLRQRLMRTFITYSMAYGDQVERFALNQERRQILCDKYGYYTDEVMNEMKAIGISDADILKKIKESHEDETEETY